MKKAVERRGPGGIIKGNERGRSFTLKYEHLCFKLTTTTRNCIRI